MAALGLHLRLDRCQRDCCAHVAGADVARVLKVCGFANHAPVDFGTPAALVFLSADAGAVPWELQPHA